VVCDVLRRSFPDLSVLEAEDAREAMERARASTPDLVLMDLQLPDENGLEVARRLCGLYPLTSVVVVTSFDLPEYREAAAGIGVSHFLVKSTSTPRELVALARSVLEERAHAAPDRTAYGVVPTPVA
jgi:DNA-binding NarL/FixJ family response regulator